MEKITITAKKSLGIKEKTALRAMVCAAQEEGMSFGVPAWSAEESEIRGAKYYLIAKAAEEYRGLVTLFYASETEAEATLAVTGGKDSANEAATGGKTDAALGAETLGADEVAKALLVAAMQETARVGVTRLKLSVNPKEAVLPKLAGLRFLLSESEMILERGLSELGMAGKGSRSVRLTREKAEDSTHFALICGEEEAAGCEISFWSGQSTAYLYDLYTEPEYRRQGMATELLARVAKTLQKKGVDKLWIQVSSRNLGAMALYRGLGFTVCEQRDFYLVYEESNRKEADRLSKELAYQKRMWEKEQKELLLSVEKKKQEEEQRRTDERFMREALRLAKKAAGLGEVPIGCVLVRDGKVIARGYNRRNTDKTTLAHAEVAVIKRASSVLSDWRLEDCTLYVTLEPCPMCAGAIVQARIPRVVAGCGNPKAGCAGSVLNILRTPGLNHMAEYTEGVLREECAALLSTFFEELREKKNR